MSNDLWKDWEEYNLGLQGTSTGSAHNTMGLSDRPSSTASTSTAAPRRQPRQKGRASSAKSDSNGLSIIVAIIFGFMAFAWLAPEQGDPSIFTYIGTALVAGLAYRFYKVIVATVVIIGALYLFGQDQAQAAEYDLSPTVEVVEVASR